MRKVKWIVIILLLLLLYLAAGAVLPFVRYRQMPEKQQSKNKIETALAENAGGLERVMLLETSHQAWEHRIRLLQGAKSEIIMSTFDMRPGESTSDIAALLLQKAQEGVRVRILVDGFSGQAHMERQTIFYALSSHPNITVKLYNPVDLRMPWKSQGRLHDKYLIVDQAAYILGGRNTFDYFIGDYPCDDRSFDREVLVYKLPGSEMSSLQQVKDYFEQIWEMDCTKLFHEDESLARKRKVQEERRFLEERAVWLKNTYPEYFEGYDYIAYTWPAQRIALLSNPTGIYGKSPEVFGGLVELMKQAGERVIIHSPYAVLNKDMAQALKEVTEQVPDTSLMINSVANGDNVFASSDYLFRRQMVPDTGMRLYEYEGGVSYHGKSIVIDDKISIIGSYNLDLRSTYMDTELMLVIECYKLNEELSGHMLGYEADSRQIMADGSEIIPDGVTPQRMSALKKTAYRLIGLIMTPFRCLI